MVLDASAVLAFLASEPGHERVGVALHDLPCVVSAANHAEVIAKLLDRGMVPDEINRALTELNYSVLDISAVDGALAGHLRSQTRERGLSLGDRLCLALACRLKAPILTADRAWLLTAASLNLTIECIGPGAH